MAKDGWVVGTRDWPAGVAAAYMFVLPVSYLATWLLGMPYIYWLQRTHRMSTWRICAAATCCGVMGMWTFQEVGKGAALDTKALFHGALMGAALSVCVALAFCWIVKDARTKHRLNTNR